MAVLKNNQTQLVFRNSRQTFITGLDPLGLQNTAISTYAHLVPGLTNLTNRIRYYGFYCWLLDYYARHIRDTNPKEQFAFIRKAELIMAIIMKANLPEYTQVTGAQFASELIDSPPSDYYDIYNNAVQQGSNRTYWKAVSGALGQYYIGAMNEMGLTLRNDSGNFICTSEKHHNKINGLMLANAFRENISDNSNQNYIAAIKSGKLPVGQLSELFEYFALNGIPQGTKEKQLYCAMLLQEDQPMLDVNEDEQIRFNRKIILKNILQIIRDNDGVNGWQEITRLIYTNKGYLNSQTNETLQLWYYYHVNELFHFGADSVFWGMMHMLDTKYHIVHLSHYIESFAAEILQFFTEEFQVSPDQQLLDVIDLIAINEKTIDKEIVARLRRGDYKTTAGLGLALMLSVYKNNNENGEALHILAETHGVVRDGNAYELFKQIEYFKGNLSDFVKDLLLRNFIYRHQYVAFRKTGNGTQTTLKFVLEENYIRHIESFAPKFTSPRLTAFLNVLNDLNLITGDFKISSQGLAFLNEHF